MVVSEVIAVDGSIKTLVPANGKKLSLEELQAAVGGYIELVRLRNIDVYVNEDGKVIGLPLNRVATEHALAAGWQRLPGDTLVGPVVFVHKRVKEA